MSFPARHIAVLVALGAGLSVLTAAVPAHADSGPVFVVPSPRYVPIPINGRDAAWQVVEGDIGLARPGHLTPVIIGGGRPLPPQWSYHGRPYYPRYGTPPARGRNEVDPGPDRWVPEPAEPFHRSWSSSSQPQISQNQSAPRQQSYSAESQPVPATIEDPNQPFMPAPIVVVPRGRRP